MKALTDWFERQARQEQRTVYLEDALLDGRFGAYALYRLRYFAARYAAAAAAHAVKFVLLYTIFSRRAFVALLLAEALAGFISSFWWGALETMRARVRHLFREGRPHLIPREVERWLTVSFVLAAATLGAAAGWLAWSLGPGRHRFDPAHLYGLAVALGLALQFVTRTFHSGVYALRRVYRPWWAIVGVEFAGLGAVLLFWPVAGDWSFPAGMLTAVAVGAALTVHYSLKLYRFLGLAPSRWWNPRLLKRPFDASRGEFVAAGLSYAVMKLDAVLVLGLFEPTAWYTNGVQLFILFFLMRPTLQAGFDWAQLFYFDLKRLEVRPLEHLLDRYERRLVQLAWLLGIAFWLLGSLTGTIVYLRSLGDLYWLLGPFFVSRSLVAAVQIQAFCARRYAALLGTACLWLLGFGAAVWVEGARAKLLIVSLATLAVYLVLARREAQRRHAPAVNECVGLPEWLSRLNAVTVPVRVRSVSLSQLVAAAQGARGGMRAFRASWHQRHAARRIARRLGGHGCVTLLPGGTVVWFELADVRPLTREWLVATCGGAVRVIRDAEGCADGRAALRRAWAEHDLGAAFGRFEFPSAGALSLTELEQTFSAMFPDGKIYASGRKTSLLAPLASRHRRGVLTDAVRFVTELRSGRWQSPLEVTGLCVAGRLEMIFVTGRRADRRQRRQWRTLIRQANVKAALGVVVQ